MTQTPGMPSGPAPSNGVPPLWLAWEAALVDVVRALADGASVTVTAAEELSRPAKLPGMGRKLLGRTYQDVAPWVRFERSDAHLVGHCISDHREIGFPLSADEKAALARLGWHAGSEVDGPALLRWFPDDVPGAPYLPATDAAAAARAASLTFLEVFGVTDPTTLAIA